MGYFLLFEGMLDSVIYARDNHLAPGGLLLPNRCNISLLGYGDVQRHQELIGFWENVYGFDMTCIQEKVLVEASIEICKEEHILTDTNVIADLNLMTVDVNCANFSYDFKLIANKAGKLTALCGFFDTFFELPNAVAFSTSPRAQATHWKQTLFYFRDPIEMKEGDLVCGTFKCNRDRNDLRALFIEIHILGKKYKYYIN